MKTRALVRVRHTCAVCICSVAFCSVSHAYVFNFEQAKVASYVNGNGGLSNMQGAAYANSCGTGNTVDQNPSYDYSGEVGFLFAIKNRVKLLLGGEYIESQAINGARVYDSGGSSELADLTSNVYGILGNVGFEFTLRSRPTNRLNLGIVGTYASVTFNNAYNMTAAGSAKYPSVSPASFSENGTATGLGGKIYLGYEFLFTDNVTLSLVGGYRYLTLTGFLYNQGANTILGNVNTGDTAKDDDGTNRTLDLSGPFVGLSLRFYFL